MTSALDELAFRPAVSQDAERIAVVVVEGFTSYLDFAPPGWPVPAVQCEAGRVAATLAQPSAWCRLAEHGPSLVGHVGWLAAAQSRVPDEDPGLAHFWQLFIRPAWWGSGLATRLHAAAVDAASARAFTTMRMHTPAGHARARRFYEREGWTLRDEYEDEGFGMPIAEYRRQL